MGADRREPNFCPIAAITAPATRYPSPPAILSASDEHLGVVGASRELVISPSMQTSNLRDCHADLDVGLLIKPLHATEQPGLILDGDAAIVAFAHRQLFHSTMPSGLKSGPSIPADSVLTVTDHPAELVHRVEGCEACRSRPGSGFVSLVAKLREVASGMDRTTFGGPCRTLIAVGVETTRVPSSF
jgi:hypothetical protein